MSDRPVDRVSRAAAWGLLVLVLGGAVILGVMRRSSETSQQKEPAAESPPILYPAPAFHLVAQNGSPFSPADLAGKVWIADFIFTSCAGPCPTMTQSMAELQKRFRSQSDVRFVSFSVDPQHDTPAVLTEYASRFGADPARWTFLTGDEHAIYSLALEGFRVLARRATTQELQQAGTQQILHSPYFFLVDKAGRIRGTYDGTDSDRMSQLVADVNRVLTGK